MTNWKMSSDALRRLRLGGLDQLSAPEQLRSQFRQHYCEGGWPPLWVRCEGSKSIGELPLLIAGACSSDFDSRVFFNPLVLDTTSKPWSITIVLREWSEHVIDFDTLMAWSCAPEDQNIDWSRLRAPLVDAAIDENDQHRWRARFEPDNNRLWIDTAAHDDVEQRVGRIPLSPVAWPFRPLDMSSEESASLGGRVDVLLLPRLTGEESPRKHHRGARIVTPQEFEDNELANFLARSPLATLAADRFQAMLGLAARMEVDWRSGTTFSPVDAEFSALALVPLVSGLEKAAGALRHEYRRRRRTARAPTGTLRVSAYASQIARGRPDRVPVTRFERTADHLENRFYRGIAHQLRLRLADDPSTLAAELGHRIESVDTLLATTAGPSGVSRLHPTVGHADRLLRDARLGDERRRTIELARRALLGRFPGLSPAGAERTVGQAFEVNMPALFEESVRAILDEALPWEFIDPEDVMKESPHSMRWSTGGGGQPWLKPDIFAQSNGRLRLIGDAKYKRYRKLTDNGPNSSFAPLRRADFQQMCTYAHAWADAPRLVTIYPEADEQGEHEQATKEIASLTLSERRCLKVFTFAPERWRKDFAHREPLIRAARG